jgi:hypothetical protein
MHFMRRFGTAGAQALLASESRMRHFDFRRAPGLVTPLLALALAACHTDSGFGPDPFLPQPCRVPPALLNIVAPQEFSPEGLRPALVHSAGVMAAVLGDSPMAADLRRGIANLSQDFGDQAADTECRVLLIASEALALMEDDPATLPDREGIRIILGLAAQAVARKTNP